MTGPWTGVGAGAGRDAEAAGAEERPIDGTGGAPDADVDAGAEAGGEADAVDRAVAAFARGDPVLVHDAADREGETDLLYPATAVGVEEVVRLRRDAGGLLFVALSAAVADAFALPFRHEAIDHPATEFDGLGYDDRPSFSLSVNHRDTYTGITDEDRALTVRELGRAAAASDRTDFAASFRAPGHVHLLRAAPSLSDRTGHTELGVALAGAAGVAPAVAGAEMLDAGTGGALAPADARAYAARHGLVYVEGAALVERLA